MCPCSQPTSLSHVSYLATNSSFFHALHDEFLFIVAASGTHGHWLATPHKVCIQLTPNLLEPVKKNHPKREFLAKVLRIFKVCVYIYTQKYIHSMTKWCLGALGALEFTAFPDSKGLSTELCPDESWGWCMKT